MVRTVRARRLERRRALERHVVGVHQKRHVVADYLAHASHHVDEFLEAVARRGEQEHEVRTIFHVNLRILEHVFLCQFELALARRVARRERAELAVFRADGGVQADLCVDFRLAVGSAKGKFLASPADIGRFLRSFLHLVELERFRLGEPLAQKAPLHDVVDFLVEYLRHCRPSPAFTAAVFRRITIRYPVKRARNHRRPLRPILARPRFLPKLRRPEGDRPFFVLKLHAAF